MGEVAFDEPSDGFLFAVGREDVVGDATPVGAFAEVRVAPYAHGLAIPGVQVLSPADENPRVAVERVCVSGVAERAWRLFAPYPPFGRVEGFPLGFLPLDGFGDFGYDADGKPCAACDSAYGGVVGAA